MCNNANETKWKREKRKHWECKQCKQKSKCIFKNERRKKKKKCAVEKQLGSCNSAESSDPHATTSICNALHHWFVVTHIRAVHVVVSPIFTFLSEHKIFFALGDVILSGLCEQNGNYNASRDLSMLLPYTMHLSTVLMHRTQRKKNESIFLPSVRSCWAHTSQRNGALNVDMRRIIAIAYWAIFFVGHSCYCSLFNSVSMLWPIFWTLNFQQNRLAKTEYYKIDDEVHFSRNSCFLFSIAIIPFCLPSFKRCFKRLFITLPYD